jgi:hypothetical protein
MGGAGKKQVSQSIICWLRNRKEVKEMIDYKEIHLKLYVDYAEYVSKRIAAAKEGMYTGQPASITEDVMLANRMAVSLDHMYKTDGVGEGMDEDKKRGFSMPAKKLQNSLIAGKWMYDTFFDLINQNKDFRVEVRHDPESQKTRLKVIELSEDGQNRED